MDEIGSDLPSSVYHCPECGRPVDASTALNPGLLQCPFCHAQFFAADNEDEETDDPDHDELSDERQRQAEHQLSELHIRQVRDLRRGANRTRSWFVIGAVVAAMVTAELIVMTVQFVRLYGWHALAIGYLFAAAAALMISLRFVQKAVETTREIRAMVMPEPVTPPDFSPLDNGSQRWKNLEELTGES
jgi:uncharacterized Zn finger protein (UPF0148 family)